MLDKVGSKPSILALEPYTIADAQVSINLNQSFAVIAIFASYISLLVILLHLG